MRRDFAILYILLVAALGACAAAARRSRRRSGRSVALLCVSLIPPVVGNLILIASGSRALSTVGCYIYFIGMDLAMLSLLNFTFDYCMIEWPSRALRSAVFGLLALDAAQLALNLVFHHAFAIESIPVDGFAYFRLKPLAGQTFHRIVDYGAFGAVLVIFLVKLVRAPRIYSERYSVILLTMVSVGLWQTFYIFSRAPIDRSMIGYAVFGLLVFYFALFYRPMRLLDRMLANVASQREEALFFFDMKGQCIWQNRPGCAMTGLASREYEKAAERLRVMFGALEFTGADWSDRREIGTGDGARRYALERRALLDARERVVGTYLSIRDDTEEQRALQRERYAATHDMLTGLYTREHLYERVRERLAEHPDERYMVAFLDVKDFKIVNDIFGNDFGDYALSRIGAWLKDGLGEDCLYGRLAGDTFGVCLPVAAFDPARAEARLSDFVVRDGEREHRVLMHLGVYEVAAADMDVSVMFDRAHMAIDSIKNEYQIHVAYYDEAMRSQVLWAQHISGQLPAAIAERQVRPYLQPIVDEAGRVVGAEALVRWIHPKNGFLSPAQFIPVLERNGMIAQVDRYMWRCACEILARWKAEGREQFISVNISPKDFYFMDVAKEIRDIVEEFDVPPERLRIEITETVMMTDIEHRMHILNQLRDAGFIVEIDDFGSGYSSLSMLKEMPVDVLKVDMAFLTQSSDDAKARIILSSIIGMSEQLGIMSLTEGVETAEQREMLADMGCRLFQGYYFAKPMPVEAFEELCRTRG